MSAGMYHSLAIKSDGTVLAWGSNYYGQLGDGTTTDRIIPAQVESLVSVAAISAGAGHSLALKYDGTVWAWGDSGMGFFSESVFISKTTPVQVLGENGIGYLNLGETKQGEPNDPPLTQSIFDAVAEFLKNIMNNFINWIMQVFFSWIPAA